MCQGDDPNCHAFEEHRRRFKRDLEPERRAFLKSGFVATGAAAAAFAAGGPSLVSPALAEASGAKFAATGHYHLPANAETVHWGFFSRSLKPQVEIGSGDFVTIETLTHQASDDAERMIEGDPGAESVYLWTKDKMGVSPRGAGPMDAKIGPGGGLGVHICTGPVAIRGAEPGDVLEVRILDVAPRPSANPKYTGLAFGSNAAAWWGFHYKDLITGDKPREVVTIYEVDATGARDWARAVYSFRWPGVTDPFGVAHPTIDYPGLPVDHSKTQKTFDVLKGIRVPIRPHFGTLGVRRPRPTGSTRSRRAIPAATSTTGGSARARRSTSRSRWRGRCSRSVIPMPARAIPNCAGPRSSARSPAPSSSSCTRRPTCRARRSKPSTSR